MCHHKIMGNVRAVWELCLVYACVTWSWCLHLVCRQQLPTKYTHTHTEPSVVHSSFNKFKEGWWRQEKKKKKKKKEGGVRWWFVLCTSKGIVKTGGGGGGVETVCIFSLRPFFSFKNGGALPIFICLLFNPFFSCCSRGENNLTQSQTDRKTPHFALFI